MESRILWELVMKVVLVLILSFFSFSTFASNFTCSATVIDNGDQFSELSIGGFWRSSSSYEDQSIDVPKGVKKVVLDFDIDGTKPNEPKAVFKIRRGTSKATSFKVIIDQFGQTKTYILGKNRKVEFTCG